MLKDQSYPDGLSTDTDDYTVRQVKSPQQGETVGEKKEEEVLNAESVPTVAESQVRDKYT